MASPLPYALSRHLALAYWALVVYASLYPFAGWQIGGLSPFAFLVADWPHYWTGFDLAINVVTYVPLGFLLALALTTLRTPLPAATLAVLAAVATSFLIEVVQSWLPSRVPSNLDLLCNAAGGLLGAVVARLHGIHWFTYLGQLESRLLVPHAYGGVGVTLLGLWLLAQVSPEMAFATTGDVRRLWQEVLPDLTVVAYSPQHVMAIEAVAVAAHLIAVGLFLRLMLRDSLTQLPVVLLFFVIAVTIRSLSAAVLLGPPEAFDWLSPGTVRGGAVGGLCLLPLLFMHRRRLPLLICVALLVGTLAVNAVPDDPYRVHAMAGWQQGHFLNFNGLTRWLAMFWPLLAFAYLVLSARRR